MQATNPYATGAGGADFERRVATAIICSALAGAQIPPLDLPPTEICLQAAHLNCAFDDLVLRVANRRVFVSVKSAVSPRASDSEFKDVISKGWNDWKSEASFDRKKDALLLIAATSRSPRIHLLGKLTDIARASRDPIDFQNRLSLKGYNHSSIRDLYPEIIGVIESETHAKPDDEELRQFLTCLFVSTFDLDQDASQDKSRVIGLLRLASDTRDGNAANACWNAVFENVSLITGKAKVFTAPDFESVARNHGLRVDVNTRLQTWLADLRAHCRITRSGVLSSLSANQHHVMRHKLLTDVQEALSDFQFILLTGPPGSGKSALAVEAAESFAKPENVFCFQADEFAHAHLDAALQAARLRDLNVEEWSDALPFEPRVLVIEALERLLQSGGSQEALVQLLRTVVTDRRWHVIATCRDYLADHARDVMREEWNPIIVPLLDSPELEQAVTNSGIPDLWLKQPAVRDAMRNLKWLDLTMRAARQINSANSFSAWATLADWRTFVWRQLLTPAVDSRGQELLVQIALQRVTSGSSWVTVLEDALEIANRLCVHGILQKNDVFPNRYRPAHDLLEDWALLFHVRREFTDHQSQPAVLFAKLGSSLMLRRAFRQFLGEVLESSERNGGVSFIRSVLSDAFYSKEWREEIVNALLGSSCALDALHQTQDFWTHASGDGLRMLGHILRIAYLGKPRKEKEPELPFGPGWQAVMAFILEQGDHFLRQHTSIVTALMLDWHNAVTPECPTPPGLEAASAVVRGLWKIATEGDERFEKYWNDDRYHRPARENRLSWLIASTAGAIDSKFFCDISREVFRNHDDNSPRTRSELTRQCGELVEFLVSDHAGWVLARAHPRIMARLCLRAYGIFRPWNKGLRRSGRRRNCGLRADSHDFAPPSALRGPFLELLRHHRSLGEALVIRLVNVATYRWADATEPFDSWEQPFKVTLNIDSESFDQVADQGWWRCYRGWSPYSHIIECALMALEKWLLEDVGANDIKNLQATLLSLLTRSSNVAITGVAASIGTVHWWYCGKLASVLLECWPLLDLDRHRWMNERLGGSGAGHWPGEHSRYLDERQTSNILPHRQEHLEHFILKAQLGSQPSEIWSILDKLNAELKALPPEQVTDEIHTARLILHRIDSRKLRAKRRDDKPDQILLQCEPPPPDLQKHLDEWGKKMELSQLPMELQMWAVQILEPIGSARPEPQRWREMLKKARNLHTMQVEPERMLVFGNGPTMVASVCLRDFSAELDEVEMEWCVTQVTGILFRHSELTHWKSESFLTSWEAERGAAYICGFLTATRSDKIKNIAKVDQATSIALTHPEKKVRFAAAEGLGRFASNSSIQLAACELMILHARFCRSVDLRHRGPQCLTYDHIHTWQDRCSEMHKEILEETRRLREVFVKKTTPDLRRLALFYPRGHEEDQNLSAILIALLHHESPTAAALFNRIRNWLAIQFSDESGHPGENRKFAADSWRDHYGSFSRSDSVNVGEVSRVLARRVLQMSATQACLFYAPILKPNRVHHLRDRAGEFLKDLCIAVDDEGNAATFWAVWNVYALAAVELGSRLNDEEYWRNLGTRPQAIMGAFTALVSAVFLNDMYFKQDQYWPPVKDQSERFIIAFRTFRAYGLNKFIAFLDTIGGALLPAAWRDLSDCVDDLIQRTGKSCLTSNSHTKLLRLLAKEILLHRVPNDDSVTWKAMINLLNVLADAGFSEAFRLRDTISRQS